MSTGLQELNLIRGAVDSKRFVVERGALLMTRRSEESKARPEPRKGRVQMAE